ncbi:MAG: exonuclease SbcCD subunit D C-terminal domain-containing protein [Kiritimatiellae bacterium]|nr:exonuclease SbcCD subunit D C-terminal domain-containing protein [Kiritimatiellia bacterium]MCO5068443.1 exonuclease SbcCD subunit D C-terminal domain-containing protein [Kiritimatiellia bacterium]
MKVLHTADWHLGKSLYQKRRYEEFEGFLKWLVTTLRDRQVDALLVAGDIFDTGTPSIKAQELYYEFLADVARETPCRHVVVTGGNHDSPSFLDAPKRALRALNVHVVGSAADNPADEVLALRDAAGEVELIVGAVPYLRDRDVRTSEAGESVEEKGRKLVEGIRAHYAAVGAEAERQRAGLRDRVPIVGMGHLFAAGGQMGEGVRDLYVGGLGQVGAEVFPSCFDYLALGHLHVPQSVGGRETFRYSGSPIPMGFDEAKRKQSVCLVHFEGRSTSVALLDVPRFQRLESVKGDWSAIARQLGLWVQEDASCWVEVEYSGAEIIGNLREQIGREVEGSRVEVIQVKNPPAMRRFLEEAEGYSSLEELRVEDVFERCLDANDIPAAQRDSLVAVFREAMLGWQQRKSEGVVS